MDHLYIKKVLDGNTEEFRYFIRKYKDMAFSVAISVVKDEFSAEEVVQESFIKAYRNLKKFKGRSKFKTWFYRIVINEAFKQQRRQKKEALISYDELTTDISDTEDTFKGLNEDEQILLVNDSLKQIPERQSLVLRLYYLDGNDINEIVDLTGWSESNVKVLLHRARKSLLEKVNEMIPKKYNIQSNEYRK